MQFLEVRIIFVKIANSIVSILAAWPTFWRKVANAINLSSQGVNFSFEQSYIPVNFIDWNNAS